MTSRAQETVLIVDADILIRQPLAEYLRECGYKVVEAADVAEAKRLLIDASIAIHIVLADVDPPGPDNGFALASWIRTNYPDVEVVLAGTIEKATRSAGELCDEGTALKKPYEHQVVLARIKQSLAARERDRGKS
ncbi:response regulator [Bradyrhizobium sp. URHD0069]|uniref:response regulator n=1 Tax=Bradyrhizobium sp. URHD0069 TaxID=1380355 RepID=UPI0004967235|nr:response regulator [Bradyrhizobium sp. URHD0069]